MPAGLGLMQLWPNYLDDGYFDENGNLRLELVSRRQVGKLVDELVREKLTTSQLRRFFQHSRAIEARLRAGGTNWEAERATFLQLDVAAADALHKQQSKIPRLFHDLIQRNTEKVIVERDFLNGFIPHFQAIVGFGSGKFRNERK